MERIFGLLVRAGSSAVGALIGLWLASGWGLGISGIIPTVFIGGLIAYIAIDFRGFCEGTSRAFKKVTRWRPNTFFWKSCLYAAIGIFAVVLLIIEYVYILIAAGDGKPTPWNPLSPSFFVVAGGFAIIGTIMFAGDAAEARKSLAAKERELRALRNSSKAILLFAWRLSPPGVIHGLYKIARFLYRTYPTWKQAPGFIWLLGSETYTLVHSHRRAACATDAAIGAGIGFAVANPIIGAVVGVLFGLVNHEIVSRRTS